MKTELTFNATIDKKEKAKIIFDNRNYFDFMIGKNLRTKEKFRLKLQIARRKEVRHKTSYWWGCAIR